MKIIREGKLNYNLKEDLDLGDYFTGTCTYCGCTIKCNTLEKIQSTFGYWIKCPMNFCNEILHLSDERRRD